MANTKETADIGLIGLAVMGQNLVLNMNDKGFKVAVFNRTVSKVDDFLAKEAKGTNVVGTHSVEELVASLKKPRKVMLLVKAGSVVDNFIGQLLPFLESGDVLIDGGNSDYRDSNRRYEELSMKGIHFIGTGVSGGEDGARYGPSLMPGGDTKGWTLIKPIFQSICAKVESGEPCCDWTSKGGAGHYVKMVHNGIEYGDMQLIAEAYHLMRDLLGMSNDEMSAIFREWNKGELKSFLVEITADILAFKDKSTNLHELDNILDSAGQKGTGKWTAISGLDEGCPITLIAESVFARCLSSLKKDRVHACNRLPAPDGSIKSKITNRDEVVEQIRQTLYASKVISYAQGFMLLQQANKSFKWDLDLGSIALMWRGGCIIRSQFLGKIKEAFDSNKSLQNLLLDPFFTKVIEKCQSSWRLVLCHAMTHGIPVPALSCALAFYDGYRSEKLPANLIQAQRDYFGAHQYEQLSKPGEFIHTNWTGHGGTTASSTYQV